MKLSYSLQMTVDFSRNDVLSKGLSVAMCGRVVDDEIMLIGAENKKRYALGADRPSLLKLIYVSSFRCQAELGHQIQGSSLQLYLFPGHVVR